MKLELQDLNNGSVFVGDKLNVRAKFSFEENSSIFWSGLRLITHPPCVKELLISNEEIFSKGDFEAGDYIRDRSILIKNNVVPSIKNRNLEYEIKLIIRQPHPLNPKEEDLIINKSQTIDIIPRSSELVSKKQNPIATKSLWADLIDLTNHYQPS